MQIDIDSHSGFCYGVTNSINLAEKQLQDGQKLVCIGEIVHNEEEVSRLQSIGMDQAGHEKLSHLQNTKVLIRAHGEPPETFEKLRAGNNEVIDGTCPIVLHLQKKVRKAYNDMQTRNGQIVIFGKKGHAEVIGLAGQTKHNAIVVSSTKDLETIDFTKPIALFSQTTQSPSDYLHLVDGIKCRYLFAGKDAETMLTVTDSICGHVSKRGEHLTTFVKQYDVIVFVSGTHSSNGKVLFETCRQHNPKTFWVSAPDQVQANWFAGSEKVGICGATSTPQWLMEKVKESIQQIVV